jgi:hypothetical protein
VGNCGLSVLKVLSVDWRALLKVKRVGAAERIVAAHLRGEVEVVLVSLPEAVPPISEATGTMARVR